MPKSNVAVVGLGGIGLGFAAALAEGGGARVVGCARRPLTQATIEREGKVAPIELELTDDPSSVGRVDWVVVATKVYQTDGIIAWLEALVGEGTRIVVAQNGIHRDRALLEAAPRARAALASVIYFNGESRGDGAVRYRAVREVDLILPESSDAAEFAALLAPFMRVALDPRFDDAAWRKFLLNVAANSLTALTMRRSEVIREPHVRALALRMMEEAAAVARADGTPLATDAAQAMLEVLLAYPTGVATSMYLDREAGRRTEVDAFNGAVVALGRRFGIATPANETVLALLHGAYSGGKDTGQAE